MKGNETLQLHVHCETESKKTPEIALYEWFLTVYLNVTAEIKYLNT